MCRTRHSPLHKMPASTRARRTRRNPGSTRMVPVAVVADTQNSRVNISPRLKKNSSISMPDANTTNTSVWRTPNSSDCRVPRLGEGGGGGEAGHEMKEVDSRHDPCSCKNAMKYYKKIPRGQHRKSDMARRQQIIVWNSQLL